MKSCQTRRDSGERESVIREIQVEQSRRGSGPSMRVPSSRNWAEMVKPSAVERGEEQAAQVSMAEVGLGESIEARRRFSQSISFSRNSRMEVFEESLNSAEVRSRHFSQTAYSRVHSLRW